MSETAYQPLVSIIINNYNYESYLPQAIESALNQNYPNVEIIVVDDGSTDQSRTVLQQYEDDHRIYLLLKENGGQSSALNSGFEKSSGEIICLLDADDVFLPEKVTQVVQAFAADTTVQWCFHCLSLVGIDQTLLPQTPIERSTGKWDYRHAIAHGQQMPYIPTATSGLCFRRTFLAKICPLPEAIRITSDNYLKFIASALGKGYFLNQPLAIQKIHDRNAYTLRNDKEQVKAEVVITTAYWIRVRYPFLATFANGLMVRGIGMARRVGQLEAECYNFIKAYFKLTRWVEYFTIHMMVLWYWIKSYGIHIKTSR
jgi:glycosyltransferase involved in cell wall biosynthesis